jgi:hypothetical protein
MINFSVCTGKSVARAEINSFKVALSKDGCLPGCGAV